MNSARTPSHRRLARFPRAIGLAAFGLATFAGGLVAQEQPAGPVVELPKLIVTDSRELPKPESWRYAQIPGFEVLTSASDRSTEQLIRDFSLFKAALSVVFPVPSFAAAPTPLILVGRAGKFAGFVPSGRANTEAVTASVFLKNREQSAIVIDFSSATIDLFGSGGGTVLEVDHHKQLYREYVHFLLGRNEPRPPAWLEEGMAQIIMAMRFTKDLIEFGKLEDPNEVSVAAGQVAGLAALERAAGVPPAPIEDTASAPAEDRDFAAALKDKALMPLQELFEMGHDSPAALNPLGNNVWAKQCYAFVHMCLYGRGGQYKKPFAQFLTRLSKQPPSETLFQECFKMSYKKMAEEMRGYLNFTDYKPWEFHAKKGGGLLDPPPLVLRDATQSEIGRIKGDAYVLAGHADQARVEFTAAYVRGERDPQFLAAFGAFQRHAGDDERARKLLEAATAAKVDRPASYLELAQMRYADALAKPAAADGFSIAQVSSIVGLLNTARKQVPSLPGVYELMCDTWVHSAAKPKPEEIAVLVEGVKIFPTRLKLMYQTTVFCLDAGMNDLAGPLIDYGLKIAPDIKVRDAFARLKEALPVAGPPVPVSPAKPLGR
ncbi:MAG: hypothetical protein ABIZ81_02120 [Opitutaceae bacterium]